MRALSSHECAIFPRAARQRKDSVARSRLRQGRCALLILEHLTLLDQHTTDREVTKEPV